MAHVAYQVDEVPGDARSQAFFPTPSLSPAGQSSVRRFIRGYPGTRRVPSPDPAGSYTLSSSGDWLPPSHPAVTPDWFAPQVWWNEIRTLPVSPSSAGLGVDYLPKPVAADVPPFVPQGVMGIVPGAQSAAAEIAMTGRKVGGFRSMKWPRVIIRWPNLGGRYS